MSASPSAAECTISVSYLAPITLNQATSFIQSITGGISIDSTNFPWTISNKYYTADVSFQLSPENETVHDRAPAVIVLAARTSSPDATIASTLADHAKREPEYDVALLVALETSTSSGPVVMDEDTWDDLALEHGFEWIDHAQGLTSTGTRSETAPHDSDRDSQGTGLDRIISALHAHMWDSMVPQERVTGKGAASSSRQLDGSEDDSTTQECDDSDDLSHLAPPSLPTPRPYIPQPVSFPDTFLPSLRTKPSNTATQGPNDPKHATDAAADSFGDAFAPFEKALHPSQTSFPPIQDDELVSGRTAPERLYRHAGLSFPDSFDDDQAGDQELEELDDLFANVLSVRGDLDGLSLEERRERAELAMKSLGLLGGGEPEVDDERVASGGQ